MRKLSQLMHDSLDGFIATPEGELDWIIIKDRIKLKLLSSKQFSLGMDCLQ
jgi:hypothetical protein